MPTYIITLPDDSQETIVADAAISEQSGALTFIEFKTETSLTLSNREPEKLPFHMMTIAPGEWKRVRRSNVATSGRNH